MNAKVISDITLDVAGGVNRYTTVRAKQGDNLTRLIHAKITNGGKEFPISNTSKVLINFKRYDNETKSFDGEIDGDGTLMLPLPYWALEIPYTVTCDVSIIEEDTRKLTTFNFYIEVEAASVSDDDVQADDETSFLLQLIQKTEELAQDFKGHFVNNSTDRILDVTIENRTQYCYSAGITSCMIVIPENAEQGWVSDFALKINDEMPVVIKIVNHTQLQLKLIQYSMEMDSFTANPGSIVHIYIACDGMTVSCVVEELGG